MLLTVIPEPLQWVFCPNSMTPEHPVPATSTAYIMLAETISLHVCLSLHLPLPTIRLGDPRRQVPQVVHL